MSLGNCSVQNSYEGVPLGFGGPAKAIEGFARLFRPM
jgi:hypothetical protein